MRVISGSAKGRSLKSLPGLDTRPTTGKVKEAIFNIIQFDIEGRRVLDLFGGTGQMAIEALSRGAKQAVIVDSAPEAVKLIQENVDTCRFHDLAQVIRSDASAYLARKPGPFELIFLDPPYRTELLKSALEQIAAIDILSECGIIICESLTEMTLPQLDVPYVQGKTYSYGKTKVTLYQRLPDPDAD